MRIAAYVAFAIVSKPGVVAGGRKGVVAIEGVFSHPRNCNADLNLIEIVIPPRGLGVTYFVSVW